MAQNIIQETPMPWPDRPIIVNGKKYLASTTEPCRVCTADERILYVRMRLSGGELTLECAFCDTNVTKRAEEVRQIP